jgi:predicted MPP superfamily phosphohydrolase
VPFFVVALSIWLAMHATLLWHVWHTPFLVAHVPRWVSVAILVILAHAYLASRFAEVSPWPGLAAPLEIVGTTWMGVLLLLLTCLLASEIVTGFGWLLPKLRPILRGWAMVAGLALSAIALVQGLRPPVVTDYEVKLPGLPAERDGTVVAFISDLHLGTMTSAAWMRARAAEVNALQPDLVIVGGDVFEGRSPNVREEQAALRMLHAPLGVFAVTGNHDDYSRRPNGRSPLDDAGVKVLRDEWVPLSDGLVLAGVLDGGHLPGQPANGHRIERALAGRPAGVATVFVSHIPVGAETAARLGAGLMLSGHTHGGQIWPFGYFVRRLVPLFVGRYDVDGMTAIVGRGTGTWGPRMRLWQRGEVLRIVLRA